MDVLFSRMVWFYMKKQALWTPRKDNTYIDNLIREQYCKHFDSRESIMYFYIDRLNKIRKDAARHLTLERESEVQEKLQLIQDSISNLLDVLSK